MEGFESDYEAYMFKVIVVGNAAVGKTSCIKRLVYNVFESDYKGTIGVDFAFKIINLDDGTQVRLQFWDIAGQERFGNLTHAYYKDSYGAFVVADVSTVTSPDEMDDVVGWKNDIDCKVSFPDSEVPIPCVLLLNKYDLVADGALDREVFTEWATAHGFAGVFFTSALNGEGLKEATTFLVDRVLDKVRTIHPDTSPDPYTVKIDEDYSGSGQSGAGGSSDKKCSPAFSATFEITKYLKMGRTAIETESFRMPMYSNANILLTFCSIAAPLQMLIRFTNIYNLIGQKEKEGNLVMLLEFITLPCELTEPLYAPLYPSLPFNIAPPHRVFH